VGQPLVERKVVFKQLLQGMRPGALYGKDLPANAACFLQWWALGWMSRL
jgi:hypothetical protein